MKLMENEHLGVLMLSVFMIAGLVIAEDKMRNLVIEKSKPREVSASISRLYEESVCFEEKADAGGSNQTKEVTLTLEKASLEDAVRNFTSVTAGYSWNRDKETGVVNIYPTDGSRLDWRINKIEIVGMTFGDIFDEDVLGFRKHGINFFPGRGKLTWLNHKVSLQAKEITARQALNLLCKELPFKARWEIMGLPGQTNTMLMFQGYASQ